MKLYDVIIIGGGPGGSTAATFLAQKGHSVLVIEKEKFPREHIGESLIPLTFAVLNKLGLIEDLKKMAPRKPGVNFVDSDGKRQSLWCFKNVIEDKSYLTFHVVRSAFDKLLLDNSRKNGAEVLEQTMVKNVIIDSPDGIVKVHTTGATQNQEIFHSKFIIDASGQSTFLGSKLGVKKSYDDLDRVAVFSHWTNTNFDTILKEGAIKIIYLGGEKKGWVWVIPISSEHLSIGIVVNNDFVKKEKHRLTENGSSDWKTDLYNQELFNSPAMKTILEGATMNHKVQIIGDYSYHCEKKYGDNYAMIGDAGAFLDPIFSSGIHVAMHSAWLVSDAIHIKLTGGNAEEAMAVVYKEINGALNLLEKFIRLFYTPEAMNFATIEQNENLLFEKFEMAYQIFHFLLAGDFFKNYEKYSGFIDMVTDKNTLVKYQNFIKYPMRKNLDSRCDESFVEMYGEMTHKVEFDHTTW